MSEHKKKKVRTDKLQLGPTVPLGSLVPELVDKLPTKINLDL